MMDNVTMIACKNIGFSGTTEIHVKEIDGKFVARMGFAIMGSTQMDKAGFEAAEYNPFHDEFYDNYAEGIGDTQDDAIKALQADMEQTTESFWAQLSLTPTRNRL